MEQSDHVLQRIQEWKTNFEIQGEAKLAEIQRLINVNGVLEAYFQEIDRLPEELRKSNLYDFIATCETTDSIGDKPAGKSCIRQKTKNGSRMDQKPNTWANRLRGPRKLVPKPLYSLSNITPACKNTKSIVLKTPAGNIRMPRAITPKVHDGDDIKFRTLRREEVAFSVAGTPVIAGNETESDENAFLVNELLHARDEELTPQTRNVVRGMKQLIGRIRTSEVPEHL
uniref:Borealin N-terminal domain-containing protein n=1 Tax=Onchocerca volvulus TaxID=6282 RepID=A0A8R1TV21_ONCVO